MSTNQPREMWGHYTPAATRAAARRPMLSDVAGYHDTRCACPDCCPDCFAVGNAPHLCDAEPRAIAGDWWHGEVAR